MRGSWRLNRTASYWPPLLWPQQRFFLVLLSCSIGVGGPASLGAGFLYRILSPTGMISNCSIGGLGAHSAGCWFSLPHLISNWLNFLCTELYNSSTPTFFLWALQIALIKPVHSEGYILIFLDRMHLLFIQVILTARQGRRTIYNTQTQSLLINLELAADGIGLHFNASKTECMFFIKKEIYLIAGSLKLVDKFTNLGSSIISTENYISMWLAKLWNHIDWLSIKWK